TAARDNEGAARGRRLGPPGDRAGDGTRTAMFDRIDRFVRDLRLVESEEQLSSLLESISLELGFAFFALTHHVDIRQAPQPAIRLATYPAEWVDYFDGQRLGPSDPVHRASHLTSVGFAWSEVPAMIPLTRRDRDILDRARLAGIGDGFTIPAHVPGESHGSCSFATRRGEPIEPDALPRAQLVGAFAFEAARRLWKIRAVDKPVPGLTDRQRDCLLWAARGKSDWEISRILGISHETVIQHLKQARERYGVGKRTLLAVHALFDGTISFLDIVKP
ncbi:MAG TPA: LuxR family transcriptional regulator, partial [Sphingomicrobium sp.]|nr:LuxR family transcriptional regulator [Sphingomicrobium sp.]